FELLGVVEILAHRIGQGRVLMENTQVQLVRPPVAVHRSAGRARKRALASALFVSLCVHISLRSRFAFLFGLFCVGFAVGEFQNLVASYSRMAGFLGPTSDQV